MADQGRKTLKKHEDIHFKMKNWISPPWSQAFFWRGVGISGIQGRGNMTTTHHKGGWTLSNVTSAWCHITLSLAPALPRTLEILCQLHLLEKVEEKRLLWFLWTWTGVIPVNDEGPWSRGNFCMTLTGNYEKQSYCQASYIGVQNCGKLGGICTLKKAGNLFYLIPLDLNKD